MLLRLAAQKFVLSLFFLSLLPAQLLAADYTIEPIAEDVYRFVDDRHRSVFMVTDAGIIMTDPMNPKAAKWLKQEFATRFNKPVRYVIYSHNHSDHIYGGEVGEVGEVFEAPGVDFVAQRLAAVDIELTRAKAVQPNITFDDEMTLSLGGKTVELRYHGPNDGRGSISMRFLPSKTLFVVDWIVLGRMPWKQLWSYDIHGMINSTRDVLELDFVQMVGGHADVGDKAAVREYLHYLETLYAAVVDGIHQGKSLETLQKEIRLPEFSHLRNYDDWIEQNIAGVHERLMEESGMGWRPDL